MTVCEKGTVAFFYSLSGAPCKGTTFSKVCANGACNSKLVYSLSYYADGDGIKRMYTKDVVASFEGYERCKWFQTSKKTVFDTTLLIECELSLYYSHMGFLPKCRIYNSTHQLQRPSAPGCSSTPSSSTSAPPPPPPDMDCWSELDSDDEEPLIDPGPSSAGAKRPRPQSGNPDAKRQKHTLRFSLNRFRLQEGVFSRRIALFVSEIAPWLRDEIEVGTANLQASMVQVNHTLLIGVCSQAGGVPENLEIPSQGVKV